MSLSADMRRSKAFSLPNILTAGGPERSTTTLLLYIYQLMTQAGDYSAANAATVLAVLLMSVVLFAVLKLERKVVFYS